MPRANSFDHDLALGAAQRLAQRHPEAVVPPGGSYAEEGTATRDLQEDMCALNRVAVAFACGEPVDARTLRRARNAMRRW